jgi:ketosteroid isomerase-like protein
MRNGWGRTAQRVAHVAALSVLVLAGLVSACSRTPPEQALRQTIAGMQEAAERRDAAALKDTLAEDFIGPGGLDRQGLVRMAQAVYLQHQDIDAKLGPLEVEVRGQAATVRFTAALTGGEGLLPDSAQVYDVNTEWRLQDDEWQLVRANWKERM